MSANAVNTDEANILSFVIHLPHYPDFNDSMDDAFGKQFRERENADK